MAHLPLQLAEHLRLSFVRGLWEVTGLASTDRQMDLMSDAQLIAACLDGQQNAWEELVNRYSRLIYSIAFKSGLNAEDAADVVQNVFVTVLRRLETIRERDRFSSWLITTAKRESWHLKSGKKDYNLDDEIDVVDQAESTEESMIAWEQAHLTRLAVNHLGDRCQRLLTAIFLTENRPSYQEIGEDLGIAVGSIGPIRARCLKQLREHITQLGVETSG